LISVTSSDYKTAEKMLKPIVESAKEYVEKHEGRAAFVRKEE